jgi:hypothetical protein
MVDSVGLRKIYSIPKARSTAYKKTEKFKRDSEQGEKGSNNTKKDTEKDKKRVGTNIDELC